MDTCLKTNITSHLSFWMYSSFILSTALQLSSKNFQVALPLLDLFYSKFGCRNLLGIQLLIYHSMQLELYQMNPLASQCLHLTPHYFMCGVKKVGMVTPSSALIKGAPPFSWGSTLSRVIMATIFQGLHTSLKPFPSEFVSMRRTIKLYS